MSLFFTDPRTPLPVETDEQGRFKADVDAFAALGVRASWRKTYSPSVKLDRIDPGSVHDVVLRLPGQWSVRGVLLDPAGLPVSGGLVQLWFHWPDIDPEQGPWPDEDPYTNADESDEQGRFSIGVDRLGSFVLMGTAEGAAASDTVVVAIDEHHPHAEVSLSLYAAVAIRGRVVRPGGEPVVGATVYGGVGGRKSSLARLYGPAPSSRLGFAHAETDEQGAFELSPLHPHGIYEVTCVPDRMMRPS